MAYAETTKVPVVQTRGEIEKAVMKSGADNFAAFTGKTENAIAFEIKGRRYVFKLPIPDKASDQEHRARWRGLLLCIKAKIDAVERGIETFEEAFLAHMQMPDGHSVYEHAVPQIRDAYAGEPMRPLLSGPRAAPPSTPSALHSPDAPEAG